MVPTLFGTADNIEEKRPIFNDKSYYLANLIM